MLKWLQRKVRPTRRASISFLVRDLLAVLELRCPGFTRQYAGELARAIGASADSKDTPECSATMIVATVLAFAIETDCSDKRKRVVREEIHGTPTPGKMPQSDADALTLSFFYIFARLSKWLDEGKVNAAVVQMFVDEITGALNNVPSHARRSKRLMGYLDELVSSSRNVPSADGDE